MLDHFSILTTGGLVLWSRDFTPTPSPFDALIKEALIEERSSSFSTPAAVSSESPISHWQRDGYALLWTLANELELVFVVAYQRILQLAYVEDLLRQVKQTFLELYEGTVRNIVGLAAGREPTLGAKESKRLFSSAGWAKLFKGWEEIFSKLLRDLEMGAAKNRKTKPRAAIETPLPPSHDASGSQTPSKSESEPVLDAQSIARNIANLKARQKASKASPKSKSSLPTPSSNGNDSETSGTATPERKKATKWADSKVSAADLAAYDYSSDTTDASTTHASGLVSSTAMGKRTKSGLYEVADYDVGGGAAASPTSTSLDDDSSSDEEASPTKPKKRDDSQKPKSTFASLMARLSLSPKTLTSSDLAPALAAMREHLMAKNVASDIAEKVCTSVGKSLEGRQISGGLIGGTTIKKEVRAALEESLVKILTPKTSTDLLLEITRKKTLNSQARLASGTTKAASTPYSITFVGVNGVGKSTNLSKVAFWLLQNKLRVLIAACDTFRSGAVEQLRVHVRNLGRLGEETGKGGLVQDGVQMVELYERGYGKDASGIAKDAIAYGKEKGFDVVLIDTAGRMQDNEPLMRALAKLVTVNNPDKIVFVGEALVGNEAVDQLTKFNRSLRDFSGVSNARGIDGMILTKFDTIDDKVGAALSMTYVTGQPILFVGTGQTYSDLRSLRVAHIVSALLQD